MPPATALSLLLFALSPTAASGHEASTTPSQVEAPDSLFEGARTKETLTAQVLLDHSNHSPGLIDGIMGSNTVRAIRAFQRANGLVADGALSGSLIAKLRSVYSGPTLQHYTITQSDVAGPFVDVPSGMQQQAQLDVLSYETVAEALAEKFHMSEDFLKELNPDGAFETGKQIVVVVPGKRDSAERDVARIEVDKAASALRAFSSTGELLATFPATVGSGRFPSPNDSMEVRAIAPDPTYHFDPSGREWGPDERLTIAAGPNNPVGSTWIDLSKDGYGIHGTPEPGLVGKTSSHGCVRLTNWDAEMLARSVSPGTTVDFI